MTTRESESSSSPDPAGGLTPGERLKELRVRAEEKISDGLHSSLTKRIVGAVSEMVKRQLDGRRRSADLRGYLIAGADDQRRNSTDL